MSGRPRSENPSSWHIQDVFASFPKSNNKYRCLLDRTGLHFKRINADKPGDKNKEVWQSLELRDIVGCICMKDRGRIKSANAYFCVYAYPLRTKLMSKGKKRSRANLVFQIDKSTEWKENLAVAERWRNAIIALGRGFVPKDNNEVQTSTNLVPKRHLLIFVNPHSGPGKALKIFNQRVVPVLAEAAVTYDLIITENQNHAYEYVQTAELRKWNGIVIVSGDGLVYEIFNGLMQRKDWKKAIKMPIGVIPGGSGNGLAKAISYALKEPDDTHPALMAALTITKGFTLAMDLICIHLPTRCIYSFLSIGWGLIADIDIGSERLRSIGPARFTIWALAKVMALKSYRGRLAYLPIDGYDTNTKSSKKSYHSDDDLKWAQKRLNNTNSLLRESKSYDQNLAAANSDEEDEEGITENGNGSLLNDTHSNNHSVPSSATLLRKFSEAVPTDWIQSEEEFVAIHASYQSHISTDVLLAPAAKLDDGIIWLLIIRKGVSRSQLTNVMLSLENGSYVKQSCAELIPVRAFRLEPLSSGSYMTVDGETVEYGPIQAEVMPSVARVMGF